MGQADKCIECMKEIYEVDYSFRDVAERVEGFLRFLVLRLP